MGLFIGEAIEEYTGLSPTAFFTILALMFGVYQLVSSMFVFEQQHDLNKPEAAAAAVATKEAPLQQNNNNNNNNSSGSTGLGWMSEEELQAYDGSDPNRPLLMAIKGHIYDVSPSRGVMISREKKEYHDSTVAANNEATTIGYLPSAQGKTCLLQVADIQTTKTLFFVILEDGHASQGGHYLGLLECAASLPSFLFLAQMVHQVSTLTNESKLFYGPGGPYALFAGRDASRALALMSFDPNDLTGNIEGLEPSELEVLQDWEYKFQEKYAKVGQLVTENTRNRDTASLDRTDGNVETARDAPI